MSLRRRITGVVLSLAAVAAIGWADYASGPDIGFSLFYLVPIALSGWYLGSVAAIVVAVAAAGSWLTADLALAGVSLGVSLWNAFTRLVIYVSEGLLLAVLRSDRERMRQLIEQEAALARTDPITTLPNGRAFLEMLDSELHKEGGHETTWCLVYVDLDNFKAINDLLGHAAGDAILAEVGSVLVRIAGSHDSTARLGGDEFAVVLKGVDEEEARRTAEAMVQQIREIGSVYTIGFGATAGVVFRRGGLRSAEDLLRAADDAMYRGKMGGKGRAVLADQPQNW